MNLYGKNMWLLRRPLYGVLFVSWLSVSIAYYWWLISRISVLENQNNVFKTHLQEARTEPYQAQMIPDKPGSLCETVHIALVCMGKCTRFVSPTFKSILNHRQNPLHFHILTDAMSEKVMSKMFDTWDLPDVQYTCYDSQSYLNKVRWIPNSHYSGIFALVKLLFPEILPETVKQVIVLDSDLTFLCDVAELWHMFGNMTSDQIIGLVENESYWYFGENRWPALGRGFNTGVMLLNLNKMRHNFNWAKVWPSVVMENLTKLKETTLADQDVINAIIKAHPNIVHSISCQYNVQMSTKTLAKSCYGEDVYRVKIIHWNSPVKYNIRVRDSEYFKSLHESYVDMNGYLLREKLHRCYHPEVVSYKLNTTDLCVGFRAAQRIKLRTLLYYMEHDYQSLDNFDVTLVVQLSMDRLQFLERLVKHWEGPISAAIYLSDCEVPQLEKLIQRWSNNLSTRTNIGYHLVFKHPSVHYPVNYLRNVALEHVSTEYVFLMDVDFVPMEDLYSHLRGVIKAINPYPQKKVLVVPAFETQRYRASPPRDKRSLLARLRRDVAPFRSREWPRGHRPTNYTAWATAEKPYDVEWESDYEPYLVVHRSVPKYDTRFSGFGWNKVSHGVELRARRYVCAVLPGAFVVHTPHAPSPDITAFRRDPAYRVCLALLKQEFIEDLKRKYNATFDDPRDKLESPFRLLGQAKSLVYDQGNVESEK